MHCPDTVSCADTLAFAARDAAAIAGKIYYAVQGGRRDGSVSLAAEVSENLPAPSFTADQLVASFAGKGLSAADMVTLSGAHSIGVSHCSSFSNRLYKFNSTHPQDPTMDPNYASSLKARCPNVPGSDPDPTVVLDPSTPAYLDNRYYVDAMRRRGLLTSDQTLASSRSTVGMVTDNARHGEAWAKKFAAAMVRMGSIQVLTGAQGEIRKNCRVINSWFSDA